MKILQKICFVLLLTTFSSVYGGDCWKDNDVDDCRVRAKKGDVLGAVAQATLGVSYFIGRGVPQDYVMAHMYFNIAASNGSSLGESGRNAVATYLTPSQIVEAQRMAREWMRAYQ